MGETFTDPKTTLLLELEATMTEPGVDLFDSAAPAAAFLESKVDRTTRIITNVVLCGPESTSRGRRYPESTLTKALPLYERVKIYEDHPVGDEHRKVSELAGRAVAGSQRVQDGKIIAEVKAFRRRAGDDMLNIAEDDPSAVGMSHNARGVEVEDSEAGEGRTRVDEIISVRSVDLVTEPGTTKGLHENAERKGGTLTDAQKVEEVAQLLGITKAVATRLIAEATTTAKENDVDIKKVTAAELEAGNPELFKAMNEAAVEKAQAGGTLKTITEQRDAARRELAIGRTSAVVAKVLALEENKGLPKATTEAISAACLKAAETAGTTLEETKVVAVAKAHLDYLKETGWKPGKKDAAANELSEAEQRKKLLEGSGGITAIDESGGGSKEERALLEDTVDVFMQIGGCPPAEKTKEKAGAA